ncbi:hypothetical protein EAD89_15155 [Micromonospora sp. BL4]|uniref:AIPR family protein n=1 Tax=Micromonospora sp. BL4 TaxID=2478710 RepID=UPI000EF58B6E|nr:AIPR family protein [Micromonospora sp. BL4]RLP89288.1 hypothetical protein EAD89_15155 [Micromonospora sp. BL4]
MTATGARAGSIPLAAWQVRKALEREFSGLIDMTDPAGQRDASEQMFRTRAEAALVIRSLTGCDSVAAARSVVDGFNDEGIDAVATDADTRLWLVQSKWSDHGDKSISVGEVNSLLDGMRLLTRRDFSSFNPRLRAFEPQILQVLENPRRKIVLVLAVMGTQAISRDVARRLDDAVNEFNRYNQDDPLLDYRVFLMKDLRQILKEDLREAPIRLEVGMGNWHKLPGHLEAYQGEVAVGSVASWKDEYGDRLFERNLRKPLGQTEVNLGMVNSLLREPENFGVLNNGITMLCESVEPHLWNPSAADSPVNLNVVGASIVNGAQSVSAISEAVRQDPLATKRGYVSVRVISLRGAPEGFGVRITQATNKQNQVELRDFIALDPIQADIEDDFHLSLPQRYVVMRGEEVPDPKDGCSVAEAALALACAYPDPDLVIRAIADPDLLWERGSQGAYELLFHRRRTPSAFEIWRLVLLLRSIKAALSDGRGNRAGRAESVAEQGELLVAHCVLEKVDISGIHRPELDLSVPLGQIEQLTDTALKWLLHHIDEEFGPTSSITNTFASAKRLQVLSQKVSASLVDGVRAPDLSASYARVRAPRRPNSVRVLVDAGRIKDGTILNYMGIAKSEQDAMASWLADDPRRGQASWLNDRVRPLLWSVDGRQYTPTGLVQRMWDLAAWEGGRPKSVQGTARWFVSRDESLAVLAKEVLKREADLD